MRKINEIILHCSATPEGKDFKVADIRNWHLARGFKDIGYHYVIYRNGNVVSGRHESRIGAHVSGHNANSLGICYIGGMDKDNMNPKDTRTQEQRKAIFELIIKLMQKYNISTDKIKGHNEYSNKACPCFNMNEFRNELKEFIITYNNK